MPTELTYADGVAELAVAEADTLAAAVDGALQLEGRPGALVSVHLADDALLRELNRIYRGLDRPTDVLSFLLGEEEGAALGDVVLSRPRASAQAGAYGHSELRELCYLAVHGTLHLLGYDDADAEGEAAMAAKAEEVLGRLGVVR